MRNFANIIIFLLAFFSLEKNVYSQISEQKSNKKAIICATSYPDYIPLSYYDDKNGFYNIFEKALKDILHTNNLSIQIYTQPTYVENIQKTKTGNCDLLLGIYNETQNKIKEFEQIEYLYPAIIQNPINLVMLPSNISKIKSMNDLKKLKGIYISKEYFSDYILEVFSNYDIKPEENANKAYEKLFLGEIDFIVGGYYYNYIQTIKLGIKDFVSFSKKSLWTMPMFIGLSKKSPHYKRLKILLSKKIIDKSVSEQVEEEIKRKISIIETDYIGIVPPSFILKQDKNILTPADETNKDKKW